MALNTECLLSSTETSACWSARSSSTWSTMAPRLRSAIFFWYYALRLVHPYRLWFSKFLCELYGVTMMLGTLFMFKYIFAEHGQHYALTLASQSCYCFSFFDFKSRAVQGNTFNASFFAIGKRWHDLAAVLALHVLIVHWTPVHPVRYPGPDVERPGSGDSACRVAADTG